MAMINKPFTAAASSVAIHYGLTANAWQLPGLQASTGLVAINNPTGSGVVVRVYRVRWSNLQMLAVTVGNLSFFELWRVTSSSDGTPIPCVPWIWDGDKIAQKITVMTNAASTPVDRFRRVAVSMDEPAFGTSDIDGCHTVPWLNYIWQAGIESDAVEPITIREGYGFEVRHLIDGSANPSLFTGGCLSMWVDFTIGVS